MQEESVHFYIGTFVDFPTRGEVRIRKDHLLGVDKDGFIRKICPSDDAIVQDIRRRCPEDSKTVLSSGSFMGPTFCDLHLHAPQFLYQGTGLHLPLLEWLNQYAFKAEERIDSDPVLARRVYACLAQRLKENGTGAVLLFGTIKEESNLILAEEMLSAGVRAFVGKLSMDQSSRKTYCESSAESSIEAAASFIDKLRNVTSRIPPHEQLVQPVITPRFIPTCSDGLLDGLGRLARDKGVRVQSHLAESQDEVDAVQNERGQDDMAIFNKLSLNANLHTTKTIQAHCTFLSDHAFDELRYLGTAVAHCPLSNAYFSSEPFRLKEALEIGVKVGLGTDIAGGYSMDIMNAMRSAVTVSKLREGSRRHGRIQHDRPLGIDWRDALYLATRGGAAALDYSPYCGLFEVGAPFDAQLIAVYDQEEKAGIGQLDFFDDVQCISEGVLEKWWCVGDNTNRRAMWIQGNRRL